MDMTAERGAWHAIGRVAARQHGLVTRAQLEAVYSPNQVRRLRAHGAVIPCVPGVWRMPTAPMTWKQHVMLGCLAAGPESVASHATAGTLWRLEGIETKAVEITIPRNRSWRWTKATHPSGWRVVAHRIDLAPGDVVRRRGIPTTSVARTLLDLAGRVGYDVIAAATDEALRTHRLTLRALIATRQGRSTSGVAVLDRIIAERQESGVGESCWEDRLQRWMIDAGFPVPQRQFPVNLPSGPARLDFAYPEFLVAVEFDGYAYHHTRRRFDRDRIRLSELTALGWSVVIVTSTQGRARAIRLIRSALVQRGWPAT